MADNKIHFLCGPPGNRNGIGDLVRQVNGAGRRVVQMTNDDVGGMSDSLAMISDGNPGDFVLVFRIVKDASEYWSVPNYDLTPEMAAVDYFNRIHPELPPEIKNMKEHVYIALGNELDKERAEWLGWWAYYSALMWNNEGYKVTLFGWSSGEPEYEHWKEPGMYEFLKLCAERPDRVAVNLHEYSYDDTNIWRDYPFFVGRFQYLFKACDVMGIGRPTVHIGEWGWRQNRVPSTSVAMQHIGEVANLYAMFDTIKGAGLWYLGVWQGKNELANSCQNFIEPNGNFSAGYVAGPLPEGINLIVDPEDPEHPPIDPPPIEPPVEPPPDPEYPHPPGDTRGIELDFFNNQHDRNDYRIDGRIWFQFRYHNLTSSSVRYGGMGALFYRYDDSGDEIVFEPYYYQHSYKGNLPPEGGPGGADGWTDGYQPDFVGKVAMYPFLTFDEDATHKREHPETIEDGFLMGTPVWMEIGSHIEPGGPIDPPELPEQPPVEPPIEPPVEPPEGPPHLGDHQAIVLKIPQLKQYTGQADGYTQEEYGNAGLYAYNDYGRTVTSSTDDAIGMVMLGNSDSYIKLADPGRSSQQEAAQEIDQAGYNRVDVYINDSQTQPPPDEFRATHMPIDHFLITQWFSENYDDYMPVVPGHDGLDRQAYRGQEIYAPADGSIYAVGRDLAHAYGIHVRIDHGGGHGTLHAHLQDSLVEVGQHVVGGQLIGLADSTGNSTGDHLHDGYKNKNFNYVDHRGTNWPYSFHDPFKIYKHLFEAHLSADGTNGYVWADSVVPNPEDTEFGRCKGNLNMRYGPTSDYDVVGRVPARSVVRILGPEEGTGYYPVIAVLEGEQPPVEPQPPVGNVDVLSFMKADPTAWRVVRLPDGRQEDIQDMDLGSGMWVRRKNVNGEWWKQDGVYAYLAHDTSPDNDSHGNERVYTLTKNGVVGAPKNPKMMSLGQAWHEQGSHHVQFRAKHGCHDLDESSGPASNYCELVNHERNYTFNRYGQNITLDEVIWLATSHSEIQIYAKHQGKVVGWIGWDAPWGSCEIVELHWDRGIMTEEPNRWCNF